MLKELKKHRWAYFILTVIMVTFVVGFMAVWPNRQAQRWLILVLGGAYFLWGTITHFKSKYVTGKIILEYAAMSILAMTLLLLVTW